MNVALIGLGMVSGMHVAAIRAAGLTLSHVMGRDPKKTAEFALAHKVPNATTELQDLISDRVDFVILATPPDARQRFVESLAAARIPILMEKPIERTFKAAQTIVKICQATETPLGVVFQHRMRPSALTLARHVRDGLLGDIATVELRVPWWREQSYYDAPGRGTYGRDGGGVLITQAIHQIDLMLQLCGPVQAVSAMTASSKLHDMEAEDFTSAALYFASGAMGALMASVTHYPGGAEELIINGTLSTASLSANRLVLHPHGDEPIVEGEASATGSGADPMAFSHTWHQSVIADFADALKSGRAPSITGQSALPAHALIDAIQDAAQEGRETEVPDV